MIQYGRLLLFVLLLLICLPTFLALPQLSDPNPDPAPLQTQTFLPPPSPPATIPAFPEQSNFNGCPLDLPDELFSGVKSACGVGSHSHKLENSDSYAGQLHRTRCCPVLAAWLYAAYSRTALDRAVTSNNRARQTTTSSEVVDMPLLPDDSETCVDILEKALANKGVILAQPNETCDSVYCYCGIRLHPLSCPEAFYVNSDGKLLGGERVKKLEKDCSSNNPNGYAGLGGCSKCLNSLYSLNDDERAGNTSKIGDDRERKMRSRDCELMGITWLLNKNRNAYIHTVSSVLRALMMSTDGRDPQSCTLNSDGMPLAVDSSEINDQSSSSSSSRVFHTSFYYFCIILLPLALFFIGFVV